MSRQLRTFLVALFFLFSAFGCGSGPIANRGNQPGQKTTGARGGTLSVRLATPVKTFNYVMTADEVSIAVALFLLQDRLVNFDHEKQQFVPGLAESWTTAPDGKSCSVKLRDGL